MDFEDEEDPVLRDYETESSESDLQTTKDEGTATGSNPSNETNLTLRIERIQDNEELNRRQKREEINSAISRKLALPEPHKFRAA
ncbi:unnamed protein product [Cyprideis torosa]|uniref:Uncharacterized protein n=1 Tax=Cyprideis torosa TaxID=163714 RepID=A0A7R8WTJ9_9CRUS|nr:unnamed protein product [Cyprideis torosa]CAG0905898.1 unnamed protein product [Cyprideis torosa]